MRKLYYQDLGVIKNVNEIINNIISLTEDWQVVDISKMSTNHIQVNKFRTRQPLMEHFLLCAPRWNDVLRLQVAFLVATGCRCYIYIDHIGLAIVPAFAEVSPLRYGTINKEVLYGHVDQSLAVIKRDAKELYWDYQEALKNAGTVVEPLTAEELDFIYCWAPAYGVQLPKTQMSSAECTSYKAKYYKPSMIDRDPRSFAERAERKNITEGRRHRQVATKRELRQLYDLLKFYREKNFPLEEGWAVCERCGRPYKTTPFVLPNGVVSDYAECQYCDARYDIDSFEQVDTPYSLMYGDFREDEN